MKHTDILALLAEVLPSIRQKLERPTLTRFAGDYLAWEQRQERVILDRDVRSNLCSWLREVVAAGTSEIQDWRRRHEALQQRLTRILDDDERTRAILDFTRQLGSRGSDFRADRAALRRWFGADAIADRVRTRIANAERDLVLGLDLLGQHGQRVLLEQEAGLREASWQKLKLEALALPLFAYEGASQVRLAAFRMLAFVLDALPSGSRETALDPRSLQFIYRTAQEPRQDPWLQCETLLLLSELSAASCAHVISERLAAAHPGDDFFVRRRALRLALTLLPRQAELAATIMAVAQDPSDYVRQTLAELLGQLPTAIAYPLLPRLACQDAAPEVRARAVLALGERLADQDHAPLRDTLVRVLREEPDAFVLRTGMLTARRIIDRLAETPDACAAWSAALSQPLRALHTGAREFRVRRWAAMSLEYLRAHCDPRQRGLLRQLQDSLGAEGSITSLPDELQKLPEEELGRLASVLAQADFGLHLQRQWRRLRVRRGHRFARRMWRILHEWRHPSPDKRQAHTHTLGRVFNGHLHAPSAILAELSETKVPGEPLHFASEDGWRPYLPLVDQLLSLLDEPAGAPPLQIVTAEGITKISPPPTLSSRLAASARLSLRFAEYAHLRNRHEEGQQAAERYTRELRALGFDVSFAPWAENGTDPSVTRFFAGAGLPLSMEEIGRRFENYFFSAYENTLGQLALFTGTVLSIFIGRHLLSNFQLRRARAAIPLVIGGWGTRGKSGTERLKAALFNGLGYSVLSKTTGCEAMFLYGAPFQPLREMFLFRSYDKASIWEQHSVTCMAAQLKVDVMLWECMALTPSFVDLLQKRWMRDDLSTITNTFPDHEDIQGPAGIDIPRVMTHFIPQEGHLITSEEQMLPILAEAAKHLGTPVDNVGWLESGLLTTDIRARFPYEEHPDNIALVVRMARQLGVEEDFALHEMADRVVPDIGVLKVFPAAPVDGRQLSFANGMSANERFGCLNNWQRLGFDRHDPDTVPGEIISTVVNNRADRIARSRVFAGILVEDIEADYHFLIGSNLEGLLGYIRESWAAQVAGITLWTDTGITAEDVLEIHARRLRTSCTEARVRRRLAAMLGPLGDAQSLALWNAPDALHALLHEREDPFATEVARHLGDELAIFREYCALQERIRAVGDDPRAKASLDAEFRATLGRWFERKLVVVADFHATGNDIVRLIAARTPPRMHNRIMGIQNIKGTGLDFVYRWLAWGQCHRAGSQLSSSDPDTFRRGVSALAGFTDFGVLTDSYLTATLEQARCSPLAQNERIQSELEIVGSRRQVAMAKLEASGWKAATRDRLRRFANLVEGFLDAGDAIHRRRHANRIYKDLIAQRISQSRAAEELLKLTQRQKGGWLAAELALQLQRQVALWEQVSRLGKKLISRPATKLVPAPSSARK